MKKLTYTITVILSALTGLSAYGQNTPAEPQSIVSKLSSYKGGMVAEKTYLQFDKPYYAVGDTMYFKGYVTLGAAHKLSALSGVLHVDMIGPDSKLLNQQNLQITAGTAHGDIAFPDTLKSGIYRIRAYTNWMRNRGDDSFFEQSIKVIAVQANSNAPKTGKIAKSKPKALTLQQKPVIQFMPEGGSLVNGNYSKVAFKALAPNGLGISVNGTVTDETGNTVTDFKSDHLGMGAFMIVPKEGKVYKANVTYTDGTSGIVTLPQSSNKGYTINLNNTQPDTLRIRISTGTESSLKNVTLVAQAAGELLYASEKKSDGKFFSLVIPKSKFPTGIVQFTLFSPTGEPLNERLAFIDNGDELKLDAKTETTYKARQKAKIDLGIKGKDGKPVIGSFSVAVIDETKVQPDTADEQSIFSSLLLTSDLKGTVEQPGYYFKDKSEQTITDLDNLLLTQGYRHFEWIDVLTDKVGKPTFAIEKTLQIAGTVKQGSKPAVGAKMTLFSKESGPFVLDTLTDNNGRFAFNNLIFADSTKFVVQSKVAKGQDNVTLKIDTLISPSISANKDSGDGEEDDVKLTAFIKSEQQFLQNQLMQGMGKRTIALKEVTIKDRSNRKVVPNSQNLNGSGNADQVVTAKDLEKFTCGKIADCLAGMLTGVIFRNGAPLNTRQMQAKMAIVIDGNFVDTDILDNLDQADIEGIEVILGPGFGTVYGSRMANGGLIITTKKGSKGSGYYRYAPGVLTYMPKGFYKAREFYSPQYENTAAKAGLPDLRSTIYWQPDVITDQDGKTSFNYYNADGKGTYRVIIEGVGADGNLARKVLRYEVK